MTGQMTIYDLLYPERINPIREVAKRSRPYWTTSRLELIDLCNTDPDIKTFAAAVKHEYSPYGFAGHFGGSGEPNTIEGWDMLTNIVKIYFYDAEGKRTERAYSWEDFAGEIADLIWSGEYN